MVRFHNDIRAFLLAREASSHAIAVVDAPPEQRGADADLRAALLDGDLEVVGHAHRAHAADPSRSVSWRTVAEAAPRCLGSALGRPDRHQPFDAQPGVDRAGRPAPATSAERTAALARARPSCRPGRAPAHPGRAGRSPRRATPDRPSRTRRRRRQRRAPCSSAGWPMKCTSGRGVDEPRRRSLASNSWA